MPIQEHLGHTGTSNFKVKVMLAPPSHIQQGKIPRGLKSSVFLKIENLKIYVTQMEYMKAMYYLGNFSGNLKLF